MSVALSVPGSLIAAMTVLADALTTEMLGTPAIALEFTI